MLDTPRAGSVHKSVVTALVAGALAGAVAKTTIAPLDRTKINFQVSSTKKYSFRAAIRFLINSYRTDGFVSLWRGNSATLARVMPFAAIQFTAHERIKYILEVDTHSTRLTPVRRVLSGSAAGLTATICTFPLDTARARMAVSPRCEYHTIWSVFAKVARTDGVSHLYRGLLPTCMGSIPYSGTSFFVFETLKIRYYCGLPAAFLTVAADWTDQADSANKKVPAPLRLAMGICGGFLGQTSSYPLDIVRRRLQTNRAPEHLSSGGLMSVLRLMAHIARTEGIVGGLYKGLSMNLVKGPIAVGISFTTYDTILRTLRRIPYFAQQPPPLNR